MQQNENKEINHSREMTAKARRPERIPLTVSRMVIFRDEDIIGKSTRSSGIRQRLVLAEMVERGASNTVTSSMSDTGK